VTPPADGNTAPATITDARGFLAKSQELSQSAADALDQGRSLTATLDAVHAGILAADAISAVRVKMVWNGEHAGAPAHLSRVAGEDGKQAAQHLSRLLPLKNQAAYQARSITGPQAIVAVQAAQRIVAIAVPSVASITPG